VAGSAESCIFGARCAMRGGQTKFDSHDRASGIKWVCQAKLGEGGMGVVYGVVNEAGVEGAMKVMLPSLVNAPEVVARFFQ
jgi:hypothetical protein